MQARRSPNGILPGRLRPIAPFSGLSAERLIVAASRMSLAEYRDGDIVLARGSDDGADYFLLEGRIDLVDGDGHCKTVQAGSADAGTSIAAVRPSLYDVTARGRVACARMAREDVALLRETMAGTAGAELTEIEPDLGETQDLSEGIIADLAADRLRLPSLPDLATRLRTAIGRRNCSNARIATLIAVDPAIAAKILRIANSPLCRGSHNITELDEAVARIGVHTVSELVICFALKDLFDCRSPGLRKEFAERTGEAVRIGACAAVIATEVAPGLADQALVAGLVSDVGAIPVLERIAGEQALVGEAQRVRALTDRLAPRIGALICQRWGLGEALVDAVRHGRDWGHPRATAVTLTELVICARYHTWLGLGRERALPRADEVPALAILGNEASPEHSLAILREAKARIDELLLMLC